MERTLLVFRSASPGIVTGCRLLGSGEFQCLDNRRTVRAIQGQGLVFLFGDGKIKGLGTCLGERETRP